MLLTALLAIDKGGENPNVYKLVRGYITWARIQILLTEGVKYEAAGSLSQPGPHREGQTTWMETTSCFTTEANIAGCAVYSSIK